MADIKPFKGILYNQDKISSLLDVTAPPYDVISPTEQDELYRRSDANVIRLILGKEQSGDNSHNNKYTRAAATFREWLDRGILKEDSAPSIYIYEHQYQLKNGKERSRIGIVALVKLEALGKGRVLPHEKTLYKPTQDRFNLLMATHATFCQIFGLYSDPKNQMNPIIEHVTNPIPELEIIDEDGVIHRMWKISDPTTIEDIQSIMKDKTLYIADGHHRYETALKIQKEMQESTSNYSGEELFNYAAMMLVDMHNQELTVLPVHRVLKNLESNIVTDLIDNLKPYFDIETLPFSAQDELQQRQQFLDQIEQRGKTQHVFGMYSGNSNYYLLTLKDEQLLDKILKQKNAENWKKLDVAILHSLIIDYLLHIKTIASQIQTHIKFVKDDDKAIDLVNSNKYQLAFFVNPTKVDQIREISDQGAVLPQKSTYFYPKPLSGLVMFRLD